MRGFVRPDTTQTRPYGANGVYPGITPCQFPVGKTLNDLLRAGTAPSIEEASITQLKNLPNQVITTQNIKEAYRNYLLQGAHSRHNGPIKVAHKVSLNNPNIKQTFSKHREEDSGSYNPHKSSHNLNRDSLKDSKLKLGGFESDLPEQESPRLSLQRPPCRQGEQVFDLEDRILTVFCIQKSVPSDRVERVPMRSLGDVRPPSRHKSPNKSIGLELPPLSNYSSQTGLLNPALNPDEDSCSDHEMEDVLDRNGFLMKTLPVNTEFRKRNTVQNSHTSSFKKISPRKLSNSGLKVAEYDSEAIGIRKSVSNKRKKTSVREERNNESQIKGRAWIAAHQQASNEIPLIVNRRESAKRIFYIRNKRELEQPEEDVKRVYQTERKLARNRRGTYSNRTTSSPYKQKPSKTLPFGSSLDQDFLDMFARDEFV